MATSGSFMGVADSRRPDRCQGHASLPAAGSLDTVRPTGWGRGMNDPEVTMLQPSRPIPNRLRAHEVALEAAGIVLQLAMRAPAPVKPVADQAIRAASSVVLNLAEGQGRIGRDRQHFWRIAYGSALRNRIRTESAAGCRLHR